MPLPTDPLLDSQWHLGNSVAGLLDLNVRGVWNPAEGAAYTGAGIRVLIIDDGFDYTHPDFDNYNQFLDFDWDALDNGSNGDNDLDPFGNPDDAHGTAVTGIIGAAADGTGAVGVAYGAELVGYRTHSFITDGWLQDIRDSIYHSAFSAGADVVNISQGIANDTASEFGFGYDAARFDEIEASIDYAVVSGRGGLGTTIVKSAGNSRGAFYDVNADDWTNDTRQVVVAAVDQDGFVSSYSSYGAAVLVSAFGTPGEVVTTDRVGADGYDVDDFTEGFNGTSSAAPMVAGVVALMYDANAGLGWRDVQTILANTARHVGSEIGGGTAGAERYAWQWNAAETWNGGGLHFSNDYGYGLVDALAAVRLAETWHHGFADGAGTSGDEYTNYIDVLDVSTVIPDGNVTGLSFSGNAPFADIVDRVTVQITFTTTFVGDMAIFLTSPDGTVSELINNVGGTTDFNGTWTFETQAFRGERADGTWTVRIADEFGADVLTVSDIVITTYGSFTTDDRYVFTNEYSDYAGVAGHDTNIVDTNGGTDTVNASAVSSSSNIRLDGSISRIDGVQVTFSGIENAVAGDANDYLYGNAGTNHLWGMRGNDLLFGGAGLDWMYGGTGNDTMYVDLATDVVVELAGEGTDRVLTAVSYTLPGAAEIEEFFTTNAAGSGSINLTGNGYAQLIVGNAGANIINGLGGNDTMRGLAGDDRYYVDSLGDIVQETAGNGNDTVLAFVSYVVQAGVSIENLYTGNAAGTEAINLSGNELAQLIVGNAGNNIINGFGGSDIMRGLGGNDRYYVDTGTDVIQETAGNGNDTVLTATSYQLQAGVSIENFYTTNAAGTAAINLFGNELSQTIVGNAGSNIINGGLGNDSLRGYLGNDFFLFNTALGGTNIDTIEDFNVAQDTIRIDNAIFVAAGGVGTLAPDLFRDLSLGAQDANDVIIYNPATGAISYDSNGLAAGGLQQFAWVTANTALTYLDFYVT